MIALTLHFAPTQLRQPTPGASLPQPAKTQTAPPMASRQQPLLSPHRPASKVHRVAMRPEQFPTPLPLTEQEKLLLAYLNKATKPDLVAGTNQTDEASFSDLEIPRIKIAGLEIKPLDDSQSEQEK